MIIDEKMQQLIDMAIAFNKQNELYPQLVEYLIRQRYTQSQVEAIMSNYLDDMTNEKHINEFRTLQDYRTACKNYAKQLLKLE